MRSLLLLALVALGVSDAAFAAEDSFSAYGITRPEGMNVVTRLEGADGTRFLVFATPHGEQPQRWMRPAAIGQIDPSGAGIATFVVPEDRQPVVPHDLWAVYRSGANLITAGPVSQPGTTVDHCQLLDFDFTLGQGDDPVLGQTIDDEWQLVGMNIAADNNVDGHPDLAVIFDSANPTGGDDDLATPGPGLNNDKALGNLLIIAENADDVDKNGNLTDPDDERFGGTVSFTFDNPVTICSITLVDIDDGPPSFLRFHRGDVVNEIPVDNMGDNSVQTISFLERRVERMDVVFGGSGGIAQAMIEPCPMLVNLDENPFGVPIDVAAGMEITDQFADLGLTFSGTNNTPGHPDKVILFDSENPTGGDEDLRTPGPGVNNDTPLGFVLIIAENDTDADMNGLVDDPDDEAAGGRMIATFDTDVTFFSITVLDVDGTESDVFEFFDESNNLLETVEIGALGDNSVQTLTTAAPLAGVRRIEMAIGGSGAITRLRWCPGDHTADPLP